METLVRFHAAGVGAAVGSSARMPTVDGDVGYCRTVPSLLEPFRTCPPGKRFAAWHERFADTGHVWRYALAGAGVLLTLAGIAMLVVPGPGVVGILLGLGMISTVSRRLATLLDRADARLTGAWRSWSTWHAGLRHRRMVDAGIVIGLVAVVGAVAVAAWTWRDELLAANPL